MRLCASIAFVALLSLSCTLMVSVAVPLEPHTVGSPVAKWPRLFEISTRPWLYSLSQTFNKDIKTLDDIPDSELQKIADMGIEVVWFMGVWSLGPYGLKHDRTDKNLLESYAKVLPGYTEDDIIGSPYAITEYVVNPELGGDKSLASLRKRLASKGMKLMVDFVPNHAAVDSPMTTQHPEYFVNAPAGSTPDPSQYIEVGGKWLAFGSDVYSGAWTDTIQWNYFNPDTVSFMQSQLNKIAGMADMVRCDMAMLELNDVFEKSWGDIVGPQGYKRPSTEFWKDAIASVQSVNPDFVFMAEAYVYSITPQPEDITLRQNGFRYTYDKTLVDDMHNGKSIPGFVATSGSSFFDGACNFLSNHDEPRAIPTLGGIPQSEAGAVIAYTLPGLKLFWQGQFEGLSNKLDVHLRRSAPESTHSDVTAFYSKLLNILGASVFHDGTYTQIDFASQQSSLIGWRWALSDGSRRLVAVNFGSQGGQYGVAVLPDILGSGNMTVTDLLTGETYDRNVDDMKTKGLGIVLDAWQAQIFDYTN